MKKVQITHVDNAKKFLAMCGDSTMLRDAKKVTSPLLKSALVLLDIKAVREDGKKLEPKSDEKKRALEKNRVIN